MSKKLLILLFALVASLCLAFGLTACGGSSENGGENSGTNTEQPDDGNGGTEHVHSYSAVTTEPTCTERGYTVYTCSCGDSYTGDYVEALGHDFVEGVCTRCGESDPDYREASKGLEFTLSEDETYYIVTGIGECADTNLVIPSVYSGLPVKEIGAYAFYGYDEDIFIESVFIPGSVETIGYAAFMGCSMLADVTLSSGLVYIGRGAFRSCAIESIIIPEGVTDIEYEAFGYCSSLVSVSLPDSLSFFDGYSFYRCDLLEYNVYDNAYYLGNQSNPYVAAMQAVNRDIVSCEIHEDTKVIGEAFYYCSSLESIVIPDNVVFIAEYAFCGCSSLESVTIGSSVKVIMAAAFFECASLKSIVIPDSVERIGDGGGYGTFANCSSLESITIGSGVNFIGSQSFSGSDALESVTFKNISGWYITEDEYGANGDAVDVSDEKEAAVFLRETCGGGYWKRG